MTSPGDDQSSGTMKLFPDLGLCICESMNKISLLVLFWYQEFARSDWMGLSGGDQTCQNNFPPDKIIFCLCVTKSDQIFLGGFGKWEFFFFSFLDFLGQFFCFNFFDNVFFIFLLSFLLV